MGEAASGSAAAIKRRPESADHRHGVRPAASGQARWSVRLIAEEAVKRKLAPKVGGESIRILLRTHDRKPWREKNGVRGGTG